MHATDRGRPTVQERREFARVEDDAIRFRWPGSRRDEPVANLSLSGAKLFTVRSAPVGSLVEVELLREGAEPLNLLATVRRVERPTRSDRETSLGMSVEFRDVDAKRKAVLARWTGSGTASEQEDGAEVADSSPEPSDLDSGSLDHRGKLWEDGHSEVPPPSPDESPNAQARDEGGSTDSGSAVHGTDATVHETDATDSEPAESTVKDLKARLIRAESLAAEALVQLARAERRVEELEAQRQGGAQTSGGESGRYAGGDDGSSVLGDPMVAELFSKPIHQPSEPVAPAPEQEWEPNEEGDSEEVSETPVIEMIERVEDGERPRSRIGAQVEEVEDDAASSGPISGAVAGFHRLAEDSLETVGFSRSELLGALDETLPANSEVEPPAGGPGLRSSTGPFAEPPSRSEDTIPDASGEREGGEPLALEASEEDVFVEVVESAESEAPALEADSQGGLSAEVGGEHQVHASGTHSWPDLEIEESAEEDGASFHRVDEQVHPESASVAQTGEPRSSAATESIRAEGEQPTVAGSGFETGRRSEDAEADRPDDGDPPSDLNAPEARSAEEDDAAAFEEPTLEVTSIPPSTQARPDATLASSHADDVAASDELEQEKAEAPTVQASAGPEIDPEGRAQEGATPEQGDEEIANVISPAIVEEISPADGDDKGTDGQPAPTASTAVQGGDRTDGDVTQQTEQLTLAELPTCTEMVEAMRTGRIVRTSRFDRLEPVSRLDIEISDLLRSSDRLDDLEKRTRGRIAPTALHRVLFVFFERGLIAVERGG